jgi:hypothetical protein
LNTYSQLRRPISGLYGKHWTRADTFCAGILGDGPAVMSFFFHFGTWFHKFISLKSGDLIWPCCVNLSTITLLFSDGHGWAVDRIRGG